MNKRRRFKAKRRRAQARRVQAWLSRPDKKWYKAFRTGRISDELGLDWYMDPMPGDVK